MSQISRTNAADVRQSAISVGWAAIRAQFSRAVVSRRAACVCGLSTVAIGFANPTSVSITEILIGIVAFCWLLAGGYREQLHALVRQPVVLATLAILCLFSISVFYGEAPYSESLVVLRKYRSLAYLILFVVVFRNERIREAALTAFGAAMVLTLVGSIMTAFGEPPIENRYTMNPANATVFRNHIVHGLCMGLFAYLMAHRFVDQPRWRWITGPLAMLAIWNTLFMVVGRTGYVTLAALIPLFCVQRLRFRDLSYVALAAALIGATGYLHSESFSNRMHVTIDEVDAYLAYQLRGGPIQPEGWPAPVTRTSCGLRLEFYRVGLELFARHPLLGVGIGNTRHHMQQRGSISPTFNLHSEYAMIAAQTGLLGIGLCSVLGFTYWRSRRLLSKRMRHLAEGMLLAMLVAGAANSLMTERTEGVLFAFFVGLAFSELQERAVGSRNKRPANEKPLLEEASTLPLAKAA